ncbi:MAG TPA: DUF4430 domain-containing protein [Solirubrobacteraceae bacterium]|nr:DUF4430 domain-containing protein [Solirubrobacteraceae bacterium]
MFSRSHLASTCGCALALALLLPSGALAHKAKPPAKGGVKVFIRVEGAKRTLLAETAISVKSESVDPAGKPEDACTGVTAAAALQQATHGRWQGKYYSGLGYSVEAIDGEAFSFESPYYWSFWIDSKPATVGICSAKLHAGEHLLFFPQCSKEAATQCPQGLFDPPVLELRGPKRARVGQTITLHVLSLENAKGAPSAAKGASIAGLGKALTVGASGTVRVHLRRAGRFVVRVSAPGAIRDELALTVVR